MSATFTIRPVQILEASRLSEFATRCFLESFGPDNTPEDAAAHVAANFSTTRQEQEILANTRMTLIAEADGDLIGYSQLRMVSAPASVTGPSPVELQRFYIAGGWYGRGVAQALMAATLEAARKLGGKTVWLSVWERNPRARSFYRKQGFVEVGRAFFWVGSDRQDDFLVAQSLDPVPAGA